MLDTLLVALVISVDTAQVKEFPQKAEVEFKKNDLKENIIKSALNFHNSGKKDDKTWNWKIKDVGLRKDKNNVQLKFKTIRGAIKTMKEVESALPQKKEINYVRALDKDGNPILISKEDLAQVVGELIPVATFQKSGLWDKKMVPVWMNAKCLLMTVSQECVVNFLVSTR
ncbi:MAG: hypothetical protein Q3Y12_01120, partial [Phocaeicola sp.]|nr:hypothetical protein [Phocaeicola sp.]